MLRVSPRQGATAPSASGRDSSGTTRAGSTSKTSPRPWQSGQAPCGELNEKARGVISGMLMPHDGHARRRENKPIAAIERVDDHDIVGEFQRHLDGVGQPPLDPALYDQPVDENVNRVIATSIELDVFVERQEPAIDARPSEPARAQAPPVPV